MALVRLTDIQATEAQAVLARMTTAADPDVRITDEVAQDLHEALGTGMHDALLPLPIPPQILTAEAIPPEGDAPLSVTVEATGARADSWTLNHPGGQETTDPPWDIVIPEPGKYNVEVTAINDFGQDQTLVAISVMSVAP